MSTSGNSERRLADTRIYEKELAEWLPERILDCHVHIGLDSRLGAVSPERHRTDWAMRLGFDQTWSQLRERYSVLFPGKQVSGLAFGNIYGEVDTDQSNSYVHEGIGREDVCAGALYVTRPEYSAEKVAQALASGFVGIKPYPHLAPQGPDEARIYDFLPRHHLAELDRVSGILMLHLPRPDHLADEYNIRDLIDISGAYPRVAIIVAHIGRAYHLSPAIQGLPHLADRDSIFFDTTANLNHEVFSAALQAVGPDRLLFGSDLPITTIRGVQQHDGEAYVNDFELPELEVAGQMSRHEKRGNTFLLYDELRALVNAVKQAGFGKEVMQKMLYTNCAGLLERAGSRKSPALGDGASCRVSYKRRETASTTGKQHDAMVAAERRRVIWNWAVEHGSVKVTAIAEALGVGETTVRVDLDILQKEGKLVRVHGGAVPKGDAAPRPPYSETRSAHLDEKSQIGMAALAHVPDSGGIFIGSGSTTYQLAARLPEGRKIHVVTSGLDIASYLLANTAVNVTILGGCLSRDSFGTDVTLSEYALEELYWNVVFMGISAIDLRCGMTTVDINAARLERKIIERGRKLVVLCDSSKLGSFAQAVVGPVSMMDVLVTDSGVDPDFVKGLTDQGVEVVVAGTSGSEDEVYQQSDERDHARS